MFPERFLRFVSVLYIWILFNIEQARSDCFLSKKRFRLSRGILILKVARCMNLHRTYDNLGIGTCLSLRTTWFLAHASCTYARCYPGQFRSFLRSIVVSMRSLGACGWLQHVSLHFFSFGIAQGWREQITYQMVMLVVFLVVVGTSLHFFSHKFFWFC